MRHLKRSCLAAACFAIAGLASQPAAALTKCTDKNGKVTYTDGECAEGAKESGVRIHDSGGFEAPKAGLSTKSGGSRSSSGIPSAGNVPNLPPRPQMGPPPTPSPLMNDPTVNAGVRQNARYQYEQAVKKQREDFDQANKEWLEKAKSAK